MIIKFIIRTQNKWSLATLQLFPMRMGGRGPKLRHLSVWAFCTRHEIVHFKGRSLISYQYKLYNFRASWSLATLQLFPMRMRGQGPKLGHLSVWVFCARHEIVHFKSRSLIRYEYKINIYGRSPRRTFPHANGGSGSKVRTSLSMGLLCSPQNRSL